MVNELEYLKETASQTAGPYVHIGLAPKQAGFDIFENNFGNVLAGPKTKGERIRIEGRVIDGSGTPRARRADRDLAGERGRQVQPPGGPAEQADRQDVPRLGPRLLRFQDRRLGVRHHQAGRGRSAATSRPMAPHINFWIVARGINIGLSTRMYFSDEAAANAKDPVLNLIEWEVRRKTLIAQREERKGQVVYRFDINIQGPDETVFFDV